MPRVSIVIPCYNQGEYIGDALESVSAQTITDLETIIIDDGSTDAKTRVVLSQIPNSVATIVRKPNGGLAAARNSGIERASGEYILPLDADDKIAPTCIEESVAAMERDETVGIVYGEAIKFGAANGRWELPPFSEEEMAFHNCIFCTALFRRVDWEKAGGYNPNMRYGWEDWDFWLSLIEQGRRAHKLDTVTFYYRIRTGSMVASLTPEKNARLHYQLMLNHPEFFRSNMLPFLERFYRNKRSFRGKGRFRDKLLRDWPRRLLGRSARSRG